MDKVVHYFPRPDKKTIPRHYIPCLGAVSHATMGLSIIHPSLFSRFPQGDHVSNRLLALSVLGIGSYLWHRPHLKKVSGSTGLIYAGYGSAMFNFGSVLFWGISREILFKDMADSGIATTLRVAYACLTGFTLLEVGREYLGYLDTLTE